MYEILSAVKSNLAVLRLDNKERADIFDVFENALCNVESTEWALRVAHMLSSIMSLGGEHIVQGAYPAMRTLTIEELNTPAKLTFALMNAYTLDMPYMHWDNVRKILYEDAERFFGEHIDRKVDPECRKIALRCLNELSNNLPGFLRKYNSNAPAK